MRLLIIACLALVTTGCQTALPKRYEASRVDAPIAIDGVIDDAEWRGASWSDRFVDIQGDTQPRPRFDTRMRMAWDDDYLYIAARLEEPHVCGKLDTHDQIVFYDNDFEVFIDPDGDTAGYYEIEVNALETIFDLFLVKAYRDGGPAQHGWNMDDMLVAVEIEGTLNDPSDVDTAWTVEFAMPWAAFEHRGDLPIPPEPGDTWRINFSRVQWMYDVVDGAYVKVEGRPEDNWVWSPQGAINMHLPEHWGFVTFRE